MSPLNMGGFASCFWRGRPLDQYSSTWTKQVDEKVQGLAAALHPFYRKITFSEFHWVYASETGDRFILERDPCKPAIICKSFHLANRSKGVLGRVKSRVICVWALSQIFLKSIEIWGKSHRKLFLWDSSSHIFFYFITLLGINQIKFLVMPDRI